MRSTPVCIACADLHIGREVPRCRTDRETYFDHVMAKVQFLRDKAREYGVPIVCAGDVFHHWDQPPTVITRTLQNLKYDCFVAVPGQHDLPYHSMNHYRHSALATLDEGMRYGIAYGGSKQFINPATVQFFGFGETIERLDDDVDIAVMHRMTYVKPPYPGAPESGNVKKLARLAEGRKFVLFITGDNHETFTYKGPNFLVVNPGSMIRLRADQKDHKPSCFLITTNKEVSHFWAKRLYYPAESGVINRDHLDVEAKMEKRKERLRELVSLVKTEQGGADFHRKLRETLDAIDASEDLREVIYQSMEVNVPDE